VHAAGILALKYVAKVYGEQMHPVKVCVVGDQRGEHPFLLGRSMLRALADEYGCVFGRKPVCALGTSALGLLAPRTYVIGHHLSTSLVPAQTDLAK
jgi:hypothetical protein